jgi:hypothetical protein
MTDTACVNEAAARLARIHALEAQRAAALIDGECAADQTTIRAIVARQHAEALADARRPIF